MITFLKRRLVEPLLRFLQQGVTPEKLALSVGLGLALGIFPVLASTTLLCGVFGYVFRVNQPAIQLINYFTYPLQLIFFIPFFQMGAWLFGAEPIPFSVHDIYTMLATDLTGTIRQLWIANMRAVIAWSLVGPLTAYITYYVLVPVFRRLAPK